MRVGGTQTVMGEGKRKIKMAGVLRDLKDKRRDM